MRFILNNWYEALKQHKHDHWCQLHWYFFVFSTGVLRNLSACLSKFSVFIRNWSAFSEKMSFLYAGSYCIHIFFYSYIYMYIYLVRFWRKSLSLHLKMFQLWAGYNIPKFRVNCYFHSSWTLSWKFKEICCKNGRSDVTIWLLAHCEWKCMNNLLSKQRLPR